MGSALVRTQGVRFGNVAVLCFLVVQALDGSLTYMGVRTWGLAIEANPVVSSAMAYAGWVPGLAGTKLLAAGFGILLHLHHVHGMVALLTAFYVAVAIIPWTALFLTH
jgi:hypothetical protein